jgi:predicted RNA-binding protein associated with RNAse of E/G family
MAHADPIDDKFLAALQSRQITYTSAEKAIEAAHQVCAELANGRSKADVAQEVMDRSGLDPYHAGYFVGASVGAYCRQFD